MADHQHVDVFIQCVDGVGASRVGRRGQHIGFAHYFQNIRCVSATSTFGMECVDGAAFECSYRVLNKTRFVQGVGMNSYLCICRLGHVQAVINRGGCCAPVFVQLKTNRACIDLFMQGIWQRSVAFT